MTEYILSEVKEAQDYFEKHYDKKLSDDKAFNNVILKNVFDMEYQAQNDSVTDGANDGGIDFVYYDEDDDRLIIGQSKYTSKLESNAIISELDKMHSTVCAFRNGNTGNYNSGLRRILQNAIDRLPDDGNILYGIFTTASINTETIFSKIDRLEKMYSSENVLLYDEGEIDTKIKEKKSTLSTIDKAKVKIDHAKNILCYESDTTKGIMVNLSSKSLCELFNSFEAKGLFDLNIRKYIRNAAVDKGINNTLSNDRENFWFKNNGIIIACRDYEVSGDRVIIEKFSIVNGGQTTTLIGKYKGANTKEFYIPCKIVAPKEAGKATESTLSFFTKIAESTNSQKPIQMRDLKSNAPEMVRLKRWLDSEKIYLEIKRGSKKPKKQFRTSIKNDELGQLILSFVLQRPGVARSGKKAIFEKPDLYGQIFRANYDREASKKAFLIDLINLYDRYNSISDTVISRLNYEEADIHKNGQQIIFALFGVLYRIVNKDNSSLDFINGKDWLKEKFVYDKFISNYKGDDIDDCLIDVIVYIVGNITESYKMSYENGMVKSVSNFFKTDSQYYEIILKNFVRTLEYKFGKEILKESGIFKR